MRILVVGSGAREHALCWRLAAEPGVERVYAAPGNPLMSDAATVLSGLRADDHPGILSAARTHAVDLVVVGPEAPLVAGLSDALTSAGITCFGPSAAAARLEASKAFARGVCERIGVPMAHGEAFDDARSAIRLADSLGGRVAVKADGLAAGKGVTMCQTLGEAESAIKAALNGGRVVVEEWLDGVEVSVIAICDGTRAIVLPAARDHKRLGEEDTGPNTGGMGAYSPVPELDDAALRAMRAEIFEPVLAEMTSRGTPFRGALFAGLMLTSDGPRVLEFNVRLGDPETQSILPRLDMPLAPLLHAAATGELPRDVELVAVDAGATVALTLASSGYPHAPRSGDRIDGIDAARAEGALVFGAAVAADDDVALCTAGGRVLTVVGKGRDLAAAADRAHAAAARISFDGKVVRHDIGRAAAGALA